jgi:hypothetical protein
MRILNLLERAVNAYERDTYDLIAHRAACRRIDERMAKVREYEGSKAGTVTMGAPAQVESRVSYRHEPMQPIPELEDLSAEVGSLQAGLATLRDSLRSALPPNGEERPK